MSYTVVIDHDESQRQLENVVNLVRRHCLIGKVRLKRNPAMIPGPFIPKPGTPWGQEINKSTGRLHPMYAVGAY